MRVCTKPPIFSTKSIVSALWMLATLCCACCPWLAGNATTAWWGACSWLILSPEKGACLDRPAAEQWPPFLTHDMVPLVSIK